MDLWRMGKWGDDKGHHHDEENRKDPHAGEVGSLSEKQRWVEEDIYVVSSLSGSKSQRAKEQGLRFDAHDHLAHVPFNSSVYRHFASNSIEDE